MSKSKTWNENALSPKCFACQRKTCCLFCQFPIDGCRKIVKQIQLSNASNWILGMEFINTHYTRLNTHDECYQILTTCYISQTLNLNLKMNKYEF